MKIRRKVSNEIRALGNCIPGTVVSYGQQERYLVCEPDFEITLVANLETGELTWQKSTLLIEVVKGEFVEDDQV